MRELADSKSRRGDKGGVRGANRTDGRRVAESRPGRNRRSIGAAGRFCVDLPRQHSEFADKPAMAYPGPVKFDAAGRRVDAPLVIVQWQNGVPVTVYPVDRALAVAKWPKSA